MDLDAAANVLAKRGYAGTTLAEIAEGAGTLAGSFYYHFESREQLVAEVLMHGMEQALLRLKTAVASVGPNGTARERLEIAIRTHLAFVVEESAYALAGVKNFGQLPEEISIKVLVVDREVARLMGMLFAEAAAEGAIDPSVNLGALRLLMLGATNWAAEWYRPGGAVTAQQLADLIVRLLFDGVSPRPELLVTADFSPGSQFTPPSEFSDQQVLSPPSGFSGSASLITKPFSGPVP